MNLQDYKTLFLAYLKQHNSAKEPNNLYEPVSYILNLGGKRLRPLLALISAEAFGGKAQNALNAALAVEVFHNFTLLHDDIMDQAPIRRGKPTVHQKWNVNTGILSGDVMLIEAYQYLEDYDATTFKSLLKVFSQTAKEVCEGQQYDMDFENRQDVSLSEYLHMIEYKTSVLVAASLQMGAIVAGATIENQQKIYDFGIHLGLAFQLQDDYLDSFGNVATFGKQIGGDILENKKTWLYIKTIENADDKDRKDLLRVLNASTEDSNNKIKKVKALYRKYNVDTMIKEEISKYSAQAIQLLKEMDLAEKPMTILRELVHSLAKRNV